MIPLRVDLNYFQQLFCFSKCSKSGYITSIISDYSRLKQVIAFFLSHFLSAYTCFARKYLLCSKCLDSTY